VTERVLLHMTAPLRDDFDIPYHDLGPRDRPPRLALVGGLHGNELNGTFVLSRLASLLRDAEGGKRSGERLQERVLIVPAVNVLGLNTRQRPWPFDRTDLNRMFPGYVGGETTQRIAAAVLGTTAGAWYRVDVHSSNLEFEELPQVRLYAPDDSERRTAALFGLPAVIERPMSPILSSTLVHAWRTHPGERFVLQAGMAGTLQPHHCERLFHALVSFVKRTGILTCADLSAEDETVHYFPPGRTLPLISSHAGLFVSRLEVGRWVQAGDTIGYVFDGFDGEPLAEVHTPVAGLLSGVRRQPLLCEGDLIARIQTSVDVEEAADTFLQGHGQ
jgi:predicted deacylase